MAHRRICELKSVNTDNTLRLRGVFILPTAGSSADQHDKNPEGRTSLEQTPKCAFRIFEHVVSEKRGSAHR